MRSRLYFSVAMRTLPALSSNGLYESTSSSSLKTFSSSQRLPVKPHSVYLTPSSVFEVSPSSNLRDFSGIGWYFANFEIPSVLAKKKIQLHFNGIHGDTVNGSQVFLDGKKIFTQKGAYSPVDHELTGISTEKPHFLAIRVESKQGGGIDRSVSLQFSDWIYIDDHHLNQKIKWVNQSIAKSVELTIKTFLRNDTDQEWKGRIEYKITTQKAVISSIEREFNIQNKNSRLLTTVLVMDNPNLWSPTNPFSYDLHTRVLDSEEHLVDEDFTLIGIREISAEDEKLMFNRKELLINGLRIKYTSDQFYVTG